MTHTVDMAAGTQISVEEYLKTVYRPDRDYVDGVVEERNLGERDHSWVQGRLVTFFLSRFRETGIAALPEWRVQVRPRFCLQKTLSREQTHESRTILNSAYQSCG